MPRIEELLKQEQEPENIEVVDKDALLESFKGWTRLALEGVMEQTEEAFSMDALFHACRARAQTEYPDNKYVRAKLRQQLQRLRDFGLVNFLGGGMYKKAFTLS
jgi:type II restriction enzyme